MAVVNPDRGSPSELPIPNQPQRKVRLVIPMVRALVLLQALRGAMVARHITQAAEREIPKASVSAAHQAVIA